MQPDGSTVRVDLCVTHVGAEEANLQHPAHREAVEKLQADGIMLRSLVRMAFRHLFRGGVSAEPDRAVGDLTRRLSSCGPR